MLRQHSDTALQQLISTAKTPERSVECLWPMAPWHSAARWAQTYCQGLEVFRGSWHNTGVSKKKKSKPNGGAFAIGRP